MKIEYFDFRQNVQDLQPRVGVTFLSLLGWPGGLFHGVLGSNRLFFLKHNFLNLQIAFQYDETPYKNHKLDFKNLKNMKKVSPPHAGNMMTLVFKKMK